MEHWMMKHAALALGISPKANIFFRVYALLIFGCITFSSMHVLHLSGIARMLEHRQNISFSVGYLFDVLARSARVISYVIMHILSYRGEGAFSNVHKQLCEARRRLSGKKNVSNHMSLVFTLGFSLVRTIATLYRLLIIDGALLSFPYHFKFVFNVIMELQLFCLLAELDQSFDSINCRLAQLRKCVPNNSLTLSGSVFVDKWRLPQASGDNIGVVRSTLVPYSAAVRNLRRVHSSLCDVIRKINTLFGVRLLVDITAQLTALMLRLKMIVTWLFDAISTSVEQNDTFSSAIAFERALSGFIVCPIHIGTVFAVVFFCSRTIKKTEQTTIELHKLLNQHVDKEGREELQIFAMQLLQNRSQFTAAGVFPLDFTLLYSFLGVITTYLVILIQFGAALPRHSSSPIVDISLCRNKTQVI